MKQKEFIPQVIGIDEKSIANVIRTWEGLVNTASGFYMNLYLYLDLDYSDPETFFEFCDLNVSDNEFCALIFERKEPVISEKFDIRKMVAQNMVEIDPAIIECRKAFFEALKVTFSYPFKFDWKLLKTEGPYFELNESFINAVREYYTARTRSQEENDLLENAQKIVDGLNNLIEMGYIQSNTGVPGVMFKIQTAIGFNRLSIPRPLALLPQAMQRLRQYKG